MTPEPLHYSEKVVGEITEIPELPTPRNLHIIESNVWDIIIRYNGKRLTMGGSWLTLEAAMDDAQMTIKHLDAKPPLVVEVVNVTSVHRAFKTTREYYGEQTDMYEPVGYSETIRCETVWDSVGNYPRDRHERCPICHTPLYNIPVGPPFKCPECMHAWG